MLGEVAHEELQKIEDESLKPSEAPEGPEGQEELEEQEPQSEQRPESPQRVSVEMKDDSEDENEQQGGTRTETQEAIPITPNKYRSQGTPKKHTQVSAVGVSRGGGKRRKRRKSPPPRTIDTSHLEEESNIFFSDADEYFTD